MHVEALESRQLLANLVGHWQADSLVDIAAPDGGVDEWLDQTNGLRATPVGDPKLNSGALNGHAAVGFGEANRNQYFRVPAATNPISGLQDYSFVVVFSTNSTALHGNDGPWFFSSGIIDSNGFGLDNDWGLAIDEDGQLAAGAGTPAATIRTDQTNLNDGAAHVAIVSQRGDTLELSVDGHAPVTTTVSAGPRTERSIKFGSGGRPFKGQIAEVRFYDDDLAPVEAAAITESLINTYFNAPPVAVDDRYDLTEDASLLVDAANGVLSNDSDVDSTSLEAALVQETAHGHLQLNSDGSFEYIPFENFNGQDRFTYEVSDGESRVESTVTLDVSSVRDSPLPRPNAYFLSQDRTLNIGVDSGVLANDINPDGLSVQAELVTPAENGVVELDESGSFQYRPNRDFTGQDTFSYRLLDTEARSAAVEVRLQVYPASLMVTEVAGWNQTHLDEDHDSSDWIELWNFGDEALNLGGWYLTDAPDDDPSKWRFPNVTVEAGTRLLVFASGKDKTDGELHTNFKLSRDGETVAVFGPDGETKISELRYQRLSRNQAYGMPGPLSPQGQAQRHTPWFLTEPTTEADNAAADLGAGLLIAEVHHEPEHPTVGESFVVTARVESASFTDHQLDLEHVRLNYRLMYGTERSVTMRDDGLADDKMAGDGIYTAVLEAEELEALWTADENSLTQLPGAMLRYSIQAHDTFDRVAYAPNLEDRNEPGDAPVYFGTTIAESNVPTSLRSFEWFVPDPTWHRTSTGSNTKRWSTASVSFGDRFYDNIKVRVRGQTTVNWSKPKFKFEFNPGHRFVFRDNHPPVDEFNLQSHFREKGATAYMGENLAFEFLSDIGVPAPLTEHLHVRQNSEFHSLASYVEQIDATFLERNGRDGTNPLYKANSSSARSTLAPNPSRAHYRKVIREFEPFDDLQRFADGINNRLPDVDRSDFIFENVDLPQVINNMAGNTILTNHDRLTKNYYMYLDSLTGRWQRIPWDMDQAFAKREDSNFSSVLYGDTEHPQATGQPIYQNHLLDAILDTPRTREMYLRRLRTLLDDYLATDYFEEQITAWSSLIAPDAAADHRKWRAGTLEAGVDRLHEHIGFRRRQLLADPLVPATAVRYSETELVSANAPVRVRIPQSEFDALGWQSEIEFDDSIDAGWWVGTGGVGYDRSQDYAPYLGELFQDEARTDAIELVTAWDPDGDGFNSTTTLYSRFSFHVDEPERFEQLVLGMRYDDGFVAYINGVEIARKNVIGQPHWDSTSRVNHEATDEFEAFTWGADQPTPLVQGKNVLSIMAVNRQHNSPDLLIQPRLVARERDALQTPPGSIVISSYEASPDNPLAEYIEINNTSEQSVDLSDWTIEGAISFEFEPGTVVPSNDSLFVSRDFRAVYHSLSSNGAFGAAPFVVGPFNGVLPNAGGELRLVNHNGQMVDELDFSGELTPLQRSIRLTEIHYHPSTESASEFIELTNVGDQELDLSGIIWEIGPAEPFLLQEQVTLIPNASLVIAKSPNLILANQEIADGSVVVGPFVGRLSNRGEQLRITDTHGELLIDVEYQDRNGWPTAADGEGPSLELISAAVTPNQASNWRTSQRTNGTPGTWNSIGPDISGNGTVDEEDLNLLCAALMSWSPDEVARPTYDLSLDGRLDAADIDVLLAALGTGRGDANLDGRFDSADLVKVFQAGLFESDLPETAEWSTGDWNCDGRVTSSDLVSAFQTNRYVV